MTTTTHTTASQDYVIGAAENMRRDPGAYSSDDWSDACRDLIDIISDLDDKLVKKIDVWEKDERRYIDRIAELEAELQAFHDQREAREALAARLNRTP